MVSSSIPGCPYLGSGRRPVVDPCGGFEEGAQKHSDSHRSSIPRKPLSTAVLFHIQKQEGGRRTERAVRWNRPTYKSTALAWRSCPCSYLVPRSHRVSCKRTTEGGTDLVLDGVLGFLPCIYSPRPLRVPALVPVLECCLTPWGPLDKIGPIPTHMTPAEGAQGWLL